MGIDLHPDQLSAVKKTRDESSLSERSLFTPTTHSRPLTRKPISGDISKTIPEESTIMDAIREWKGAEGENGIEKAETLAALYELQAEAETVAKAAPKTVREVRTYDGGKLIERSDGLVQWQRLGDPLANLGLEALEAGHHE
jgi:hypothetical protein